MLYLIHKIMELKEQQCLLINLKGRVLALHKEKKPFSSLPFL